mgnify:CR=1 FL=1
MSIDWKQLQKEKKKRNQHWYSNPVPSNLSHPGLHGTPIKLLACTREIEFLNIKRRQLHFFHVNKVLLGYMTVWEENTHPCKYTQYIDFCLLQWNTSTSAVILQA